MANSTTWKTGQSGNPGGRPRKHRALTDLLAAAGDEKCADGKGGQIEKKRLLARMIWSVLIAGEVTFYASNREWGSDKTRTIKGGEWIDFVKWLFNQVDGELTVKIDESEADETPAPGAETNAPILYLPDNGREKKAEEKPETPE